MKPLPKKPSRLIRAALSDLKKREADPRYQIEMWDWHVPTGGRCSVCLAGAVMATRLGVAPDVHRWPSDFNFDDARKLRALNYLRSGIIEGALGCLRIPRPEELRRNYVIPHYDRQNPQKFHEAMERLAKKLESVGL